MNEAPNTLTVIPTLADLYRSPGFDMERVSLQAHIPFVLLDQMLSDHPVSKEDALKILAALSAITGQDYTIDTVAVKLLTREERTCGG